MKFNGGMRIEQEVNHAKKYLQNLANFLHDIFNI